MQAPGTVHSESGFSTGMRRALTGPIPFGFVVLLLLRFPLSAQGPTINGRFPLKSGDQLSPPKVSVVGECAKAVHVSDFLPHALVKVFANHTEQIGSKTPYFTDDDIPLTRELRLGDVVTATQTVHGFTSAESRDPVTVGPYPALNKPVVESDIWACGQVVPVNNLNPGTHVNVFRAGTNPLGDADATQGRQPVVTVSLKAGDQVTAIQTACQDIPAKKKVSDPSDAVPVQLDPSPIPPPKLEPYIPGADAVMLDNLLVGSAVQVFDHGSPVGGGLANDIRNRAPVQPPASSSSSITATQTLCTPSLASSPQGPTGTLAAPVIVPPVCEGTHSVTIQNTYINSVVVLFRNGSIFDMSGGTGGDLVMDLGDTAKFQFGDVIQAVQYVGSVIGPRSQLVYVGCGNVITQHNDNARSGGYTVETQLTPANVRTATFGRLYTRPVDGDIVAQPLYIRGVTLAAGGTKNLFFIVTSTNNVYAFDADDRSATAIPVWQRNLCTSVHSGVCAETYSGLVGITSTPVIDPISKTMYVVARCSDGKGGPLDGAIFIYALDITNNGLDRVPRVQIKPTVGNILLDFHCHRNRPGLLLQNGIVYVAFATFSCDAGCATAPYHGWVVGYSASTLTQAAVFCTSPSNDAGRGGAGIWQTGKGLVGAPDGSIFFETGNGPVSEPLQDSFVKVIPGGKNPNGDGLTAAGHFTPNNAAVSVHPGLPGNRDLSDGDTDLGSGGPLLLPGGHLIGGGKQGRFYVLDQGSMNLTQDSTPDALGYDGFQAFTNTYHSDNSHAACPIAGGPRGCDTTGGTSHDNQCFIDPIRYGDGELCGPNIHSGPVFWQPDSSTVLIYQMAEKDFLKAFKYDLTTGHVSETPFLVATGTDAEPLTDGMPGGYSSVSSNGSQAGIVWTSVPRGDAQNNLQPGRLAAFDANTLKQIWSDDDEVSFAKSVPPTIGDGRVFRAIGGLPGSVIVYGLLKPAGSHATGQSASAEQSPGSCLSIQQKYANYGPGSPVGHPAGDERPVGDSIGGRFQEFKGGVFGMASTVSSLRNNPGDPIPTCSAPIGRTLVLLSSIYWSPATCAHVVQGEIRQLWLSNGGAKGRLGYPVEDQTVTPDHRGWMSRFQHGEIWWYPDRGAFIAHSGSTPPAR